MNPSQGSTIRSSKRLGVGVFTPYQFGFALLVAAQRLLQLVDLGVEVLLVLEAQLLVDDVDVAHGVDVALDVRHLLALERTCGPPSTRRIDDKTNKQQTKKEETRQNSRQRWKMASTPRMCERKALPKPWPSWAPLTRPAMSTMLRYAGTLLAAVKKNDNHWSVYSYGIHLDLKNNKLWLL